MGTKTTDKQAADDLARFATAHHEAGHAVAHILGGGQVTKVTVAANGHNGLTHTREKKPLPGTEFNWAVMCLAGKAAEIHYLTTTGHTASEARRRAARGATTDTRNAHRYSSAAGVSLHAIERAADALVRSHWGRITRAATTLHRRGRITGSQI